MAQETSTRLLGLFFMLPNPHPSPACFVVVGSVAIIVLTLPCAVVAVVAVCSLFYK
jgi:hypothetical protein